MKVSKQERVLILLGLGEFLKDRAAMLTKKQANKAIPYVNWAYEESGKPYMQGKRVSDSLPVVIEVMKALADGESLEMDE